MVQEMNYVLFILLEWVKVAGQPSEESELIVYGAAMTREMK